MSILCPFLYGITANIAVHDDKFCNVWERTLARRVPERKDAELPSLIGDWPRILSFCNRMLVIFQGAP